jgi:hypothetical protein
MLDMQLEGKRVHADLGVVVRPHQLGCFIADCSVAQRCSFGAARDDADVFRHYGFAAAG